MVALSVHARMMREAQKVDQLEAFSTALLNQFLIWEITMYDVTELYDGLVAIRRAQQVLPETISRETRANLKVILKRIEGKLIVALSHLNADELAKTLEALYESYAGQARAELEALMWSFTMLSQGHCVEWPWGSTTGRLIRDGSDLI